MPTCIIHASRRAVGYRCPIAAGTIGTGSGIGIRETGIGNGREGKLTAAQVLARLVFFVAGRSSSARRASCGVVGDGENRSSWSEEENLIECQLIKAALEVADSLCWACSRHGATHALRARHVTATS